MNTSAEFGEEPGEPKGERRIDGVPSDAAPGRARRGSRGAVRGPDKLTAKGVARTAPSIDPSLRSDQLQPLVAPQDTHFRQVPLRTRVN